MAFKMTGWSAFTKSDGKKRRKTMTHDRKVDEDVKITTENIKDREGMQEHYDRQAYLHKKNPDSWNVSLSWLQAKNRREEGERMKKGEEKGVHESEIPGKVTTGVSRHQKIDSKITKKKKHKKKEFSKKWEESSSASLGKQGVYDPNKSPKDWSDPIIASETETKPEYTMTKTKKSGKTKTKPITEARWSRKAGIEWKKSRKRNKKA
tara:strand:- start:1793 stop:2413 length:621 start_codon:yes stop_codon:yes gene_type:complete